MSESGQTQPLKHSPFKNEYKDRISHLPDCLLVEILSHLPDTKYAIRTATLSKRWKHIWTTLPNLAFLHPYETHNQANADFFYFVHKTLTQRGQVKLNKFRLHSRYNNHLESHIHNSIRYAVNCSVQVLNLTLWGLELRTEFPLDQFVFNNSCFTDLVLSGCAFNPAGAIGWGNLRSLRIWHGNLDEDLIENMLSGSPVLETLVLNNCYGYTRLDIASKSVKKLVICGYMHGLNPEVIEINAPNILSLKVQDDMRLSKLVLRNVSSLVEADLDYRKRLGRNERVPEEAQKEAEQEMLKEVILSLLCVKELKIGISCFKALARLEAKGFVSPSNLKVLDATSSPLYSDNGPAGYILY